MSHESNEPMAEITAQEFVSQELGELRKNLFRIQIFGSIGVVALTIALGSIAGGFASNLEPKEAAKIAKGYAVEQLENGQLKLSDYLRTEIPAQIEQAPDYALAQLPEMRENLENDLEARLSEAAKETSGKLDAAMDTYMEENKDEFKTIILSGQDKDTTDAVAGEAKKMFLAYLTNSGDGEESVQDKIDKALEALKEVDEKTTRLATSSDLTDTEKKTRRALAVMFSVAQNASKNSELPSTEEVQKSISDAIPAGDQHEAAEAPAPAKSEAGPSAPAPHRPTPSAPAAPAPRRPEPTKAAAPPQGGSRPEPHHEFARFSLTNPAGGK